MLASVPVTGSSQYLLGDALGSVRGVSDSTGMLSGTADYDVFGAVRVSSGATSIFGFTGEQRDITTGFTYLRARYLDPTLGRFTQADSVQPNAPGSQGFNLHAYVANNPTTWVDPTGHTVPVGGLGGAAGLAAWGLVAAMVAWDAAHGNVHTWNWIAAHCAEYTEGAGGWAKVVTKIACALIVPVVTIACVLIEPCGAWMAVWLSLFLIGDQLGWFGPQMTGSDVAGIDQSPWEHPRYPAPKRPTASEPMLPRAISQEGV